MKRVFRNYEESLHQALKDPKEALAYLNAALEDDDQRIFLLALKDVLTAMDVDISAFAQQAKITRQNIYRILSKSGNPRWDNLSALLNALGLQVYLTEKEHPPRSITLDKKLYTHLAREANKHKMSVDDLIHEKLSK